MKSSRSSNAAPPAAALRQLEAAACCELAVARVTLGLLNTIIGGKPSFLFPDYHWRLCDINSLPRPLARSAAEIMAWGVRRGVVLNALFGSQAAITRAVVALRRQSPYGRNRRAFANRCRKVYPPLKPSVRSVGSPVQGLRTVDILPEEVGRPLGASTLRLVRGLGPSQIEIFAHDEGEWAVSRTDGIKMRLGQDGYTVSSITMNVTVAVTKRRRIIEGVLEDFFETGTEGIIWSVLNDDDRGYDALYPIEEGDHLTIQDQLGRKLWSGKIRCDYKTGWRRYPLNPKHGQPCALGHWIHWTQRGFKPDDWAQYFIRPQYARMRGILRKRRP
jgi:hypothetical protein